MEAILYTQDRNFYPESSFIGSLKYEPLRNHFCSCNEYSRSHTCKIAPLVVTSSTADSAE